MATIITLQASDQITNSRADINTSLANLNSDKIETSVIDTDTSLAANSDAKIPSQKAVKAYVDAGGNVNATETTKGIVEEATDAEVTAGTATGGTGAKLFVSPAKLATRIDALKRSRKIVASGASVDITNTAIETNIFSTSISAGLLGTSNAVRMKIYVSDLDTGDGSATLTLRLKYGSTTITSIAIPDNATNNADLNGVIECILFADASVSAQRGNLNIFLTVDKYGANTTITGKTVVGFATGTATENSAGALDLVVSAQWSAAISSYHFVTAGYTVELIE